jgi:hypothetical protein
MADIRPDRLTTCQSEQKSVVSRRPTVYKTVILPLFCMGVKLGSEKNIYT